MLATAPVKFPIGLRHAGHLTSRLATVVESGWIAETRRRLRSGSQQVDGYPGVIAAILASPRALAGPAMAIVAP